ncbi:helix-turn-helix domain-containing protein [Nocardioides sp. W7]|uniref:ArsR/SmtB family transcription factor n=1 Tax=Nocardioides sp. W7 TaxID=2931390 RepID=UPI001FD0C02F|nr:helix-turn-helix domain-containing protein [Nocardioides sp. W7]
MDDLTRITPTPQQLKALSHPVRLRILGLLRTEGPATATGLAARLGLNTGATSYHLRQLATHGFVEDDAERGNGRDRWWRAAHQSTYTDPADLADASPEERETYDAYAQSVAVVHTDLLQRAVEERALMPQEWLEATTLSDWGIRLTAARARELVDAIGELVEGWSEDPVDDESADFVVVLHSFPYPGRLGGDPS